MSTSTHDDTLDPSEAAVMEEATIGGASPVVVSEEPVSGHKDPVDASAGNGKAPISDIVHAGSKPGGPLSAPAMPRPSALASDNNSAAGDSSSHELIDIKQEALGALSPLVGHLDQTPLDKFRTTMMMIQGSDDHTLIKTAYEAAKQIEDEKLRAQALLDIINEINYFTQHQQS